MVTIKTAEEPSQIVVWMAKKLYDSVQGDNRKRFLDSLKDNKDYVISSISNDDIRKLIAQYVMQTDYTVDHRIWCHDSNLSKIFAEEIVSYMANVLLKNETENIN